MPICIKCKAELAEGSAFCHVCGKRQSAAPARKALKRANGTGTVYKLQGRRKKPWAACRAGVMIGTYATKTEALEALDRTRNQEIGDRYNATFEEVYKLWKEEHFRELTKKGIEQYEYAYKHCTPLHNLKFRSIRLNQYQSIIDTMAAKGRTQSTCNKVKQLIGQMSQWALREDIITKNQAPFIKLPDQEKKEKEIFTDEEIRILWKHSSEPPVQIILILIYTGMRIGELFTMEKSNVHIVDGYMVGGLKTEAGKDRVIPIKSTIATFIEDMYNNAPDGGLLIKGYKGQMRAENFRKREYYPTLERLGIPKKTPHSCRHTFASMMVKRDVRPETLQKIMGHSNYSVTANVYVHQDISELQNAVALL